MNTDKPLPRHIQSAINQAAHRAAQTAYADIRERLQEAAELALAEGGDWRTAVELAAKVAR